MRRRTILIGHAPNSRAKFPRKKRANVLVNLLIKGNKSREKENSKLFLHRFYLTTGFLLIYPFFQLYWESNMVFKKLRHQLFRSLKFNLSSPHPSLSPLTPILTSSHPSLPLLPLPLLTPRSLPLTPQLHALAKTPYDSLLFWAAWMETRNSPTYLF